MRVVKGCKTLEHSLVHHHTAPSKAIKLSLLCFLTDPCLLSQQASHSILLFPFLSFH